MAGAGSVASLVETEVEKTQHRGLAIANRHYTI